MQAGDRWLSPGEAAAELGVTVKALRVYERERLVAPVRTAAGWRAYGPAQIARIHLVVVLRDLGLSLKDVGRLLDGGTPTLATVLTTQQEALEERRRKIGAAIDLLMNARLKLAEGLPLSLDDLINLSRETIMQESQKDTDLEARLARHLSDYLPPGKFEEVTAEARRDIIEAGLDKKELLAEAHILIGEMRKAMAEGDTDSENAKAAALRWRTVTAAINRPAPDVREAWRKGLGDAMADPSLAQELPFDPDVIAFMHQVAEGMRARGEIT